MTQAFHPIEGTDLLGDSWEDINDTSETLATGFSGSTAPASPLPYQTWIDTGNQLVKERNSANDAWIVVGVVGQVYHGLLSRAGGIMAGAIDMGGSAITNVGLGTGTSVARAQELSLKADLVAPALQGDATVDQDPAGNTSLVRRSWADSRYLKLVGNTMTGPLLLFQNASNAMEAVPKQQLDAVLSVSSGHRHDGTDSRRVLATALSSGAQAANCMLHCDGSGNTLWAKATQSMLNLSYIEITGISAYDPVDYLLTGIGSICFLPVLTRWSGEPDNPLWDLKFLGLVKKSSGLYATMQGVGSARFYYMTA
jgi:hypothetical protein